MVKNVVGSISQDNRCIYSLTTDYYRGKEDMFINKNLPRVIIVNETSYTPPIDAQITHFQKMGIKNIWVCSPQINEDNLDKINTYLEENTYRLCKYLNIEEATWKAEYRCINDLFYSKRLFFVEFIKWISS